MGRRKNKHKSKGRTQADRQNQSIPQEVAQSSDGENTRVEKDQLSQSQQNLDQAQCPLNQQYDLTNQGKYTQHAFGKEPSQKSEEPQDLCCGLETDSSPRQQLAASHLRATGKVDKDLLEWSMVDRLANESMAASHEVTVAGKNAQQAIEDTLDTHLIETKQKLETAWNTKMKEIEKSADKIGSQGTVLKIHAEQIQIGDENTMVINKERNTIRQENIASCTEVDTEPILHGKSSHCASGTSSSEVKMEIDKQSENQKPIGLSDNPIEQHYYSEVLMMGGTNNAIINREATADVAVSKAPNDMTSITDGTSSQIFQADNVIVNNQVITKHLSKESGEPIKQSQITLFRKSVNNFEGNEYLLFTDKLDNIPETVSIALVKWLCVFDLDQESWTEGMFAKVSDNSVYRKDYTNELTITHNSLNWVKTLGCSDNPDTLVDKDTKSFRQKVKKSIQKQYEMIANYASMYVHLTTVVFWPKSDIGSRLMKFFVQELIDAVKTNVVIVTEQVTSEIQNLKEENDDVDVCQLAVVDVMRIIQNDCAPLRAAEEFEYKLPTGDGTKTPGICKKDANWLSEDFDVLYEQNITDIRFDSATIKAERECFYKGGALTWPWLYEVGPGKLDIKREKHDKIVTHIKTLISDIHETSTFTLYHSPGSGGSTMGKRILWDLKEFAPCVQIRNGGGHSVSVQGVCEKLQYIYSKTKMPVVALIDGEDGFDMEDFYSGLSGTCVMFLLVKRNVEETVPEDSRKHYWLPKLLSVREEEQMERQSLDESCTDEQIKRVEMLSKQKGNNTVFDYGMALHSYQYTGIRSYVSSFLQLSGYTELQPWHISLAYLSLAYFYGQTAMPCMFFTHVLKSEHEIKNIECFPAQMKKLLIPMDSKNRYVRICHVYIAREILDQVLAFPKGQPQPNLSPTIAEESKRHLSEISIRFIEQSGQICNRTVSSRLSYIMKNTFIARKWLPHIGPSPTKRMFVSQILADMSCNEHYTERLRVMSALTKCFPNEAHFYAHYGRLVSGYTPENYIHAKELFDNALSILHQRISTDDMIYVPHSLRFDLMQIYHMYGKVFQKQVSLFTGDTMADKLKVKVPNETFKNLAVHISENVKQGCKLFAKCREIAPLRCNESYGYINDIRLRLMYCKFIHFHSGCGSVRKFIEREAHAPEAVCAGECCTMLGQLFLECTKACGIENMTKELEELKQWAKCLFSEEELQLTLDDDIRSIRWNITTITMKCHVNGIYRALENVKQEELEYITNGYEEILKDYERNKQAISVSPMQIDSDFKEWIFAVRHPHAKKAYRVEQVLRFVELWYSMLKSRDSTFHLFVLKTVAGMYKVREGQTKLLTEAFELKHLLNQYKTKREYPLEWLRSSNSSDNFRRQLCPTITKLYTGIKQNARTIENIGFEVLVGVIQSPNDNPRCGQISLNIDSKFGKQTLNVFFVPMKTTERLIGTRNANQRVEFVLGFGMRGYEAYNVKRLQIARCRSCATTSDIKKALTPCVRNAGPR